MPKGGETQSGWEQLDSRPRIEQVQHDQSSMLAEIRAAVTTLTGPRRWTSPGEEQIAGCTDFRFLVYSEQGKAEVVGSGTWVGTAFPDKNWTAVSTAVQKILRKNGFSGFRLRGLPQEPELLAFGPDDAVVHLQLNGMVRLSALSGCHIISDYDRVMGRTVAPIDS
ncbi:MAG: Lipoprotein confined to pathogenic [Actinomycetota bacterium]|nr:Lipoprotein confined to pathogenic [Actinomycetota bacterium]